MKKNTITIGMNRTGMKTAPMMGKEAVEGAESVGVTSIGMPEHIANTRRMYTKDARSIGSMPPPATVKGAAKAAVKLVKGEKAVILADRLGERLAFERANVRLYEAMIAKLDSVGTWDAGPTRKELETFLRQELAHFEMVKESLEALGADPTAMTPSADISVTAAHGVLKVVSDVRTNGPQGVEGVLLAELADNEGWDILVKVADELGETAMANRFRTAFAEEQTHLEHARRWFTSEVLAETGMDIQQMSAE